MSTKIAFPKIMAWGLLGTFAMTLGGMNSATATVTDGDMLQPVSAAARSTVRQIEPLVAPLAQAGSQIELAQVPNSNLACYLHAIDGQQYDLSALCAGSNVSEVVLQTGDVQVTLRWDTADDLDLFVSDPFGEEVSYFNPEVSSGGILDVDANAGCAQRMAAPVENIFWPTGGGVPGDYTVTVDLFSYCGDEVPINFELTMLVKGEVTTQTGSVSADQTSVSFPFTYPDAGAPAEESGTSAEANTPAEAVDAAGAPTLPAPDAG